MKKFKRYQLTIALLSIGISTTILITGCNSSSGSMVQAQTAPILPVLTLTTTAATTYQEYSASLEGAKDIELRPQVDGTLDRIYVDEGAYVRRGQALFLINDRIYREQYNNAKASLVAAKASLVNAEIAVTKLTPLVQNNIVSDVQLKTAKANYDVAAAQVAQAQSLVRNAQINMGYTLIKAPVDGYIGRIPYKTGSLVGLSTPQPLTILSETKDIHAYFSLSEKDYLQFSSKFPGATISEKVKNMPPVELVLADQSVYPEKGKVQTVSGQFNSGMGSISFRASFPNRAGFLRSGNTGKIRLPDHVSKAIAIPQEATFELQDKVFVFVVGDSNKVTSTPLSIKAKSGSYYLVEDGIQEGQKIVFSGFDRLKEGAVIVPKPISSDSLFKVKPL